MHERREALQRVGHLQQVLTLGLRERQILGESEADPARVVVTWKRSPPSAAMPSNPSGSV